MGSITDGLICPHCKKYVAFDIEQTENEIASFYDITNIRKATMEDQAQKLGE